MSLNCSIILRRMVFGLKPQNFTRIQSITSSTKNLNEAVPKSKNIEDKKEETNPKQDLLYNRHIYPEFLPDPNPLYRNALRERLERMDMLARRNRINIPQFYVGSILAVTYTEPHAPNKKNRFVGICIQRKGSGLRASFVLRNVVDHQGVEINFDIYDPCIQSIDCLKLERRLDDDLLYLRDAPLEYSTIPFDMEPEIVAEGAPVPINETKVTLNPPPWIMKWEQKELKGVTDLKEFRLSIKRQRKMEKNAKPWEKYDLMKIYRETIPEEEQKAIFSEISTDLLELERNRKTMKRRRFLTKKS